MTALTTEEVLATLRGLQAMDLPAHGGRTLAYVYDSGLADADAVGLEALAMFAGSNGLDPTAFPSLAGDPEGVDRPWALDMVPVLISPAEWARLETALVQRTTLRPPLRVFPLSRSGPRSRSIYRISSRIGSRPGAELDI